MFGDVGFVVVGRFSDELDVVVVVFVGRCSSSYCRVEVGYRCICDLRIYVVGDEVCFWRLLFWNG